MRSKGSVCKRLEEMDNLILRILARKALTSSEILKRLGEKDLQVTLRTIDLRLSNLEKDNKIIKERFGKNKRYVLWRKNDKKDLE